MSSGPKVQEHEADLVVDAREEIAEGVVALTLADPTGATLPAWTPGAHVDLILTPELTRQYSLCSSLADTFRWKVGVLRDPSSRGGSDHIHDSVQQGDTVRVRGPRNHFPLVRSARYQFIAGGIGVTPMLPMIQTAEAIGADWHLLYGGRSRASMGFLPELSAYGEHVALWPQDEHGLLDLPAVLGTPHPETLVYSCGPEALLSAVEQGCTSWPAGALHIERFAAKALDASEAPGALEEFEIVCQRSGVTLKVSAGVSVLDALEEAKINVMGSCREGVCGSCEAEVLEGVPDHRDSVLSDDEKAANDVIMTCVSRSLSERLVLDL
ncbi:MAG TPA: PDR/VanB family oxidoreductase [Solirubrobacteraceae bacterium]|jgi:ferredoxin-NADP reductase|nr:PDR/VanB family oxidoreductase [Solirubrobacteraceae bacterium]